MQGEAYRIPTFLIEGVPYNLKAENLFEIDIINRQIKQFVGEVMAI